MLRKPVELELDNSSVGKRSILRFGYYTPLPCSKHYKSFKTVGIGDFSPEQDEAKAIVSKFCKNFTY